MPIYILSAYKPDLNPRPKSNKRHRLQYISLYTIELLANEYTGSSHLLVLYCTSLDRVNNFGNIWPKCRVFLYIFSFSVVRVIISRIIAGGEEVV